MKEQWQILESFTFAVLIWVELSKEQIKAILKSDKQRSGMQMRVFALLQNTTDTKDVQHLSQHIYNMFGTKKNKDEWYGDVSAHS